MKRPTFYLLCTFLIVNAHLTSTGQDQSDSWPQFRGVNRDGNVTRVSDLNWMSFGKSGSWKIELGEGFSEIVVKGNQCFAMFGEMIDSMHGETYLASYNKETGAELWKTKIDSIFIDVDGWGNGPRSTPVIDEDKIFGLTGCGNLVALKQSNGEILWQKNLVSEYGSSIPRWGFSTSPVLIDGALVVEAGGADQKAFIALNCTDGTEKWAFGNGQPTYCSPVIADLNGKKQIYFANGRSLYCFDNNGDTLWTFDMPMNTPTAIPMFVKPNRLYFSAVNSVGSLMLELGGSGPKELFRSPAMKNHWSSSCYKDGYVYGFHVAALRCISAKTGEVKWTKRGLGKGSLIIVNHKLVVLSDKGKIVIAEASPEGYKEVNSFQALEGKSWTAPSFAGDRIFIRNLAYMASYKLNSEEL